MTTIYVNSQGEASTSLNAIVDSNIKRATTVLPINEAGQEIKLKPMSKCMSCEPYNVNENCPDRFTGCGYSSKSKIADTCDNLKAFLLEKNRRYGNSVSEPVKIFNKNTNDNSFFTRIDDKLSRIKNSTELRKNDVTDLAGYLILLCVEKGWTDFKELID